MTLSVRKGRETEEKTHVGQTEVGRFPRELRHMDQFFSA